MRAKLYQVGQKVELSGFNSTEFVDEPPQPWVGTVTKVMTRIVKCRPTALYKIKLEDGQEVEAWGRDITGVIRS